MNRLVGSSTIHTMREEFNGNAPVIYVVCAINNVKTVINLLEWEEYIRLSVSQICALYIRSRYRFTKKLDDKMFWKIEIFLAIQVYRYIPTCYTVDIVHRTFSCIFYMIFVLLPMWKSLYTVSSENSLCTWYFFKYIFHWVHLQIRWKLCKTQIHLCLLFFFLVRNTGSVYVRICVNTQWRHIIYNFVFIY